MAENEKNRSSEGRWKIIAGIAVGMLVMGIVFYSFQSGLMVSKVKVPGVELEFSERSGMGSVAPSEEVDDPQLRENQSRLESKLAELERQLAQRQSGEGPQAADDNLYSEPVPATAAPMIAGQWFNSQGLTYIVQQQGSYITIQELNPLLGITAVGEGNISGHQVNVSYSTAVGTIGQATLQISDDGRAMSGQARDLLTGVTMEMQMQR